MNVADFWSPWEKSISSFSDAMEVIHGVFDRWSSRGKVFAWRGQVNSDWALHSSLYRRLSFMQTSTLKEKELHAKEGEILAEVHRWGLHVSQIGRLGILPQLAMLQHYGAPTRLIDVTFNPLIGLWFAVEEKYDNGSIRDEDKDGRLFAIDVTRRLINEDKERRSWEDALKRPWASPSALSSSKEQKELYKKWQTTAYAWKPSILDARMTAQNGGFVFGGVPATGTPDRPLQWPKGTNRSDEKWKINEVRKCISIALRVHKLEPAGGGASENAVYTIKIAASAKKEIREKLQKLYGYNHSTIYPDYSGFAQFAMPTLKSRP